MIKIGVFRNNTTSLKTQQISVVQFQLWKKAKIKMEKTTLNGHYAYVVLSCGMIESTVSLELNF